MNASEGVRRVCIAIRWIGFVLGLVIAALTLETKSSGDALVLLIIATLVIASSQILAWIIAGFAAPRN